MQRWLYRVVTILTLAALTLAGRAYVYCHMSQQATTGCCCAGADSPELERELTIAHVTDPCCETRGSVDVAATPLAPLQDALSGVTAPASWTPVIAEPSAPLLAALSREKKPQQRAFNEARGSPARRGKMRARLGVTIC